MTERERQILQGGNVTAVNADEQAIGAAMKEMAEAVELPSIAGNTGKFLKAGSSKPQWADVDFSPIALTATLGQNESEKTTLTFTKTAAEVYEMCGTGRIFKLSFSAGEGVDVECVCAVTAIKNTVSGTDSYAFRVDTDKTYMCTSAAGTDAVVLTEV